MASCRAAAPSVKETDAGGADAAGSVTGALSTKPLVDVILHNRTSGTRCQTVAEVDKGR